MLKIKELIWATNCWRKNLQSVKNDVALFIRPVEEEMHHTMMILEKFGEATGLYNNMKKSNAFPISCKEAELIRMDLTLSCARAELPTTYLGLPISKTKFS